MWNEINTNISYVKMDLAKLIEDDLVEEVLSFLKNR